MKLNKKTISVDILTANFNNENYLDDFFNSIYQSTVWPKRIIFVDDKSTDQSLATVERWVSKLPQIIIVKLAKNIGFANALNEGCKFIISEFVVRIDPDDILGFNRLEKQFDFISNHDTDVLGSNVSYFLDDDHKEINYSKFPLTHSDILSRYHEGNHGVCHGAVIFRRSCLEAESYRQEYVPAEEYDIFSRLLKRGFKFRNLEESLTQVRIHSGSVSNNMPYTTIEKTFKLRYLIWGRKTNRYIIIKEYLVRNCYRKYLFTKGMKRYLFLMIASMFKPKAVIRRFLK
ncbi:glycosyltransferase [Shewanella frigidimarina]|uniref:Glycosyl transferase, family 2 n=1 Tax=Shewanella frigidimarina (strain NCIMB 400) TaxID=318167 RepID=Q07Z93_SHEFN|nr:glycosyltransferase [Shewanella frigidimarina]ABI72671.1 glycosyl transferase, family 2 [Shewanella frigidimarina NCIMB 400]